MSYFEKPPNFPFPVLSDSDSFMNKYKITIRRAHSAFVDHLHYHEFLSIWYTVSGTYRMFLYDKEIQCPAGSILFILPYAPHAMDTRNTNLDETEIISLSLPANALQQKNIPFYPLTYSEADYDERKFPLYIHFSGSDKTAADNLFSDSLSEYRKKRDMHITRIFRNLNDILNLCSKGLDAHFTAGRLITLRHQFESILNSTNQIKENIASPPSLDMAAKAADMSRRTFTDVFKKITNHTYNDMIISIKTMEAIKLLKYTTKSIAEIAEECGFSDNSHFTRACLRLTSSPPQILRREMIQVAREKEQFSGTHESIHVWESHLDYETRKLHHEISIGKI